jgi:hypothetical protein|tara:strand:- start:209 stop:508 length:300 start_codon:yes stop_codon:yes gene_type:complete
MLPKNLNTAKLKVKHVLGNHTTLATYPDSEDIIYELIRDYCGKVAKEIKFTNVSLKKKYSLNDDKANSIIMQLRNDKIIKVSLSNTAYTTYEVIKNPYE